MPVIASDPAGRPRIALAMGDPAGIGSELAAALLADRELTSSATFIVIGDARVLERGAASAGVSIDVERITPDDVIPETARKPILVDLGHLDPSGLQMGCISREGGDFALENFKSALALGAFGRVDAVAFTPFNKSAMRLAHAGYEDETTFTSEFLKFEGSASEFNIVPGLWSARVTSHVPLSGVAALITEERILSGLRLTDTAMRAAGYVCPRIAVAALNPHAGDNGNFGHEEQTIIAPAVMKGKAEDVECSGPYPSDTVFVRARKGEFDAVLTMYHDQGQIAMKLIGFDQGVTMLGGLPFPVLTPAHGSAYDIAGKGLADTGSCRQALRLAIKIGAARSASSATRLNADVSLKSVRGRLPGDQPLH
jgi:4-hydroxythreonine-4-phosphate dehydrogenase